jgi:hypothetical protein
MAFSHVLYASLIWFSLFWTLIVLWHIPQLQFLTDSMPEISFLSYPFGSRAGCWSMNHVNFSDPSRVYAVQVRDFLDDTNRGQWVRNNLVDQFQSGGDVATYSASSAQCLKMICSTRLSAQCSWQDPRGDRHKIFDSKVRLQTADCVGSAEGRNLQYPETTWPSSCSLMYCCLPTPHLPVWPAVLHELFWDNYSWLNSHFVLKCLGEKFLVGRGRSLCLYCMLVYLRLLTDYL